ncbi:chromosome transmission fidelity protein 8 [Dunaliella salina]|uniref:Chromosome transmission fidelity protein 8 n=1 Tax=Dunaliella salina TaxID=3046 RepID=A0ABQ7H908_DUNSA|nr:chromosome transmission fidelity protein 8 [Dunaliella salina]|eukprot:KAF5843339.1 chromosome transmission fidelity protein 8 [Dunaliella salina]
MLIPVKGDKDNVKEWALIELQGKVEDVAGAELSNELGRLVAVQGQKDVVRLTVGYHQLEGKRLDLKKPFAILQKQQQQSAEETGSSVSYQVAGVIKSKYLFKTRPTALISKPASRH